MKLINLKNKCNFVFWEVTDGATERKDCLTQELYTVLQTHTQSYGTKGSNLLTATLCNATLMTNSFSPFQPWELSILSYNITFPVCEVSPVPCSTPLCHRSCVLLISITRRFHFPGQRRRKSEWNEWGSNWKPHPSQHIQHLLPPSTLLDWKWEQQHRQSYTRAHTRAHTYARTHTHTDTQNRGSSHITGLFYVNSQIWGSLKPSPVVTSAPLWDTSAY